MSKDPGAYLYGEVEPIIVGIETARHRIEGKLVQHKDSRFSDTLNRQRDFIVLCDARVTSLNGDGGTREHNVLIVNRDEVVLAWEA